MTTRERWIKDGFRVALDMVRDAGVALTVSPGTLEVTVGAIYDRMTAEGWTLVEPAPETDRSGNVLSFPGKAR